MNSPSSALKSKTFKALLVTSFLGAFNDNLFRTIVSLLVLSSFVNKADGSLYLSLTAGLFATPYILFSGLAGYMADLYSKMNIIRLLKVFELFVMIFAFVAFIYESTLGLLVSVFLMGLQSALYSPSKYGMLPELLGEDELSKGNGYIEFITFFAIICGTACAGLSLELDLSNPGTIPVLVALLGIVTSFGIQHEKRISCIVPWTFNPVTPHLVQFREIVKDKGIFLCVLGSAYFFFIGTLFQLNILLFSKETLGVGEVATSVLLAALAVGIGMGSVVAGKTSEGKVETGLIPIGGIGLCILSLLIGSLSFSYYLILSFVFFLGMSGGFFIVPVNSYIQMHSPSESLGKYLAASNFLTFSGIVLASLLYWFMKDLLALSSGQIFFYMGVFSIFVAIYLVRLLPEMMVRCLNWILLQIFYRITRIGFHHIPKKGGALIVANHASFIDAQLILAAIDRPVRFIMFRPIYEHPLINPIAKLNKAIPISGADGREKIEKTLKYAASLIEEGELVGIFAEGKITRTGDINEFRPGMESIMSYVDAPVIPLCLHGVWGSIFSFSDGKVFFKKPKKIPYPLTVVCCPPHSSKVKADEVRKVIIDTFETLNPK